MKKFLNMTTLPCLIAVFGAAGAGLRYLMYRTAVDEKGLLTVWNLPGTLVLILTVLAVVLTVAGVWKLGGSDRYGENFPASIPGAAGACLLTAGIVTLLLAAPQRADMLGKLRLWAGWISIPCLLLTAYGRLRGVRPIFILHGMVCLFFGLHLADHYRVWSGEPQLADYIFQLFACVGLMLTAYQRTAFDVGLGKSRSLRITGLLTAYVCFLAVVGSDFGLFYLCGGLWCLAGVHAPSRNREVAHE